MEPGKILVSQHNGSYVIKLVGDVRVTLCTSLNNYMEVVFQSDEISEVVIDMIDAVGVDSTTLGLLAKLAIYCNDKFQLKPVVFCPDESLYQILMVMGLDDVFEIVQRVPSVSEKLEELSVASPSIADETRKHVLEAHRLLSSFNERNRQEFVDLIRALEEGS
ncbi:MAG: STAS domain-containing protein [Porticoccus sp.]|nr:STAS domain-containing protein [Porticoccus sp.]